MPDAIRSEFLLESIEALQAYYNPPVEAVALKVVDRLDEYTRRLIAASPFAVLATGSPNGLDCSPKGDGPGFMQVLDDRTLLLPDRPGNNRIDGLKNLVEDPRVGLIFFFPGVSETLRVNGRAAISVDPDLLSRFVLNDKLPRSVIAISVEEVFLHCSRSLKAARLWDPERHMTHADLPNLTEMFLSQVAYSKARLAATTNGAAGS
jgi:PPOX class probable FMN-dependent enzyme